MLNVIDIGCVIREYNCFHNFFVDNIFLKLLVVGKINKMVKKSVKGPTRPAPVVPGFSVNRYSPVTNWNDDPFGDVFEPQPQYLQKKKPPPRPPPPKVTKQPDIPAKPSHFIRKPTVLSTLLSRKNKNVVNNQSVTHSVVTDINSDVVDAGKMFPKCEPKNVQTGALIDLSSPPSSPTFTTRSSSDGLSVDSFGSDATTSTNHHNANNGGNQSQAESGFEDDFELFFHSRKNREDTTDDFTAIDPFSPQPMPSKPVIARKPILSKDVFDLSSNGSHQNIPALKGPTIIRAKPARPKPPDNTAILKSTFGNCLPVTSMNINTTKPIQKVSNGFGVSSVKSLNWEDGDSSPERESSPPMPSIPPPPPPPVSEEDLPAVWAEEDLEDFPDDDEEPYAIALYDYFTDHPDDLNFSANARIKLTRRVDDDWLYGSLRSGVQGLFPSNYVEIKVPLKGDVAAPRCATALYDFEPVEAGDLRLRAGDTVSLVSKLNNDWCYGQCNGRTGQFPINYVQIS